MDEQLMRPGTTLESVARQIESHYPTQAARVRLEDNSLQALIAERKRLGAEIADLRTRFSHHHVASSDDSCGRCGLDLRNPIHHRS
jgi:hypothetical protein